MNEKPIELERNATAPETRGGSTGAATTAFVAAVFLGFCAIAFGGSEAATKADGISASEAAKIADGYRRNRGKLMPVALSPRHRRDELMRSLHMPKSEAESLIAMVERGERTLGRLTLWDSLDEDGDIASVTAGGFTQSIPLTRMPTQILVAYIPGRPVLITGERDGMGGGVTMAVELSTGPLAIPPLAVGQTIALPIQ
jgi:hypothetical protein